MILHNYDCNNWGDMNSIGAWIFRDESGFVLEAGQSVGNLCPSVLDAEFWAMLMAIQQAWIKRYRNVIFEGDNKEVFLLFTKDKLHFGVHIFERKICSNRISMDVVSTQSNSW